MSQMDVEDFFQELSFCLDKKDVVKAKALLQFIINSDADLCIQKKTVAKLINAHEDVVFPLIEYLVKADVTNQEFRDDLYLLILDKAYSSKQLTAEFIIHGDKQIRLALIKAVGELFLTELAPELQKIISEDNDKDIIIEAVDALGKLRVLDALPAIANLSALSDPQIKSAAVFAISKSGITDAVDQIMAFVGKDEPTNIAAIKALAQIQDLYAIDVLTNFMGHSDTIIRDAAIDQLVKIGKKTVPNLIKSLQYTDDDSLIHIITTLGYISDKAAVIPILDIINSRPGNANVRQAAYEALERIDSPDTVIALIEGLKDPVEAVRMSAARAVSRSCSTAIAAWLRYVIRVDTNNCDKVVTALIDSDANNIYEYLAAEDNFLKAAGEHLVQKADPKTRRTFLKHMSQIGQEEFVKRIFQNVSEKRETEANNAGIIVIDDSKMVLKLISNKLSTLGFTPKTFNKPEEALPEILNTKPDLIITDLNMPKISGLELSRVVRKKYRGDDVPILMITTQSDFIDDKINDPDIKDEIGSTGINKILYKPFTEEEFNDAVTGLICKS